MSLRKLLLGATFLSLMLGFHLPLASADDGVVDNTTCTVLNNSDDIGQFNSLRRKIEQGFNRPEQRSCTELVNFKEPSSGEIRIKLTAPLHINNENDVDCSAEGHPLCGDGVAFTLDGTTNPGGVIIDTTGLADDKCALEVTASRQVWKGFKVVTKQNKLVTAMKSKEDAVICDNGNNNDFSGVQLDTQGGAPEVCGDGKVEGKEECDDGNTKNNDGCSSACTKEPDSDGDGIIDGQDNCKDVKNPDQKDCDGDGKGDACDDDWDNDGVPDGIDNCAPDHTTCQSATALTKLANPDQSNLDKAQEDANGEPNKGDVCDDDMDGDGVPNTTDNCPKVANPDQEDKDGDHIGAACDPDDTPVIGDSDGDGANDDVDNCPTVANPDQKDTDSDGFGDACDTDDDNDGVTDTDETTQGTDPLNPDTDGDGIIDGMDSCPKNPAPDCGVVNPGDNDSDGDGVKDSVDNCPNVSNADQKDSDGDKIGDACDPDNPDADTDGDGVKNKDDNCPTVSNASQANQDNDSKGDACDPDPTQSDNVPATTGGSGCSLNAKSAAQSSVWVLLALPLLAIGLRRKRSK